MKEEKAAPLKSLFSNGPGETVNWGAKCENKWKAGFQDAIVLIKSTLMLNSALINIYYLKGIHVL